MLLRAPGQLEADGPKQDLGGNRRADLRHRRSACTGCCELSTIVSEHGVNLVGHWRNQTLKELLGDFLCGPLMQSATPARLTVRTISSPALAWADTSSRGPSVRSPYPTSRRTRPLVSVPGLPTKSAGTHGGRRTRRPSVQIAGGSRRPLQPHRAGRPRCTRSVRALAAGQGVTFHSGLSWRRKRPILAV